MSEQFGFFESASVTERALRFDESNPQVFGALRDLALDAKRRSHPCGIATLFEVLRWQHAIDTCGDEFKLNNSYRAYYARVLMEREPEIDGFFEVRRCRSGGH